MQYKTEYSIFRDYELAREYYQEFLNGCSGYVVDQYGNHGKTDYIVIFENEESAEKSYYSCAKLKAMRRDNLIDLWRYHFMEYVGFDEMTKSELIDSLLTVTRREYYTDHYEHNGFLNIAEYDFSATGYNQGDLVKVCNADNMSFITSDYISNLFYDVPIHATAGVWTREDSDTAWELVDEFYLCEYTDVYNPCYEQVRQGLLAENKPLAHLVAYDMSSDIFENVK